MDEFIHHHDNICSLIHKKCHLESYHSGIKYHMTLNIILSVVLSTLYGNELCPYYFFYPQMLESICYKYMLRAKHTTICKRECKVGPEPTLTSEENEACEHEWRVQLQKTMTTQL